MLKNIDLSREVAKEEYKRLKDDADMKLGCLQRQVKAMGIPVIVVFEGWSAAGKGTLINSLISVPLPAALQPSKTTMTGMPIALTCRWRQPSFMSASSLSLLYSSLATSRDKSMFLSITTRALNSQALSYNIIEHSRLQSKIEDEDEDDNLA